MINTVIFDLDGTLVDTNELIADSWRYTVKEHTGRDMSDEEIRKTLGEILLDSMRWVMPEVDPEEALETYRIYQRSIFIDRIKLYDGAEETLRALKEAGCTIGLLTSRLTASTGKALAHFKIAELFDAVLTASDTVKFKPDPEPVYIILEKLGKKPGESMFVGDTVHDIEAGLASGLFTVLVDWSYALPREMREGAPAPDAIIEKMEDLLKFI